MESFVVCQSESRVLYFVFFLVNLNIVSYTSVNVDETAVFAFLLTAGNFMDGRRILALL